MDTNLRSDFQQRCLLRMLRPVVRFALRNSQSIREFTELAKLAYVEVAAEELQKHTEKINISRIAVVTGVHRPDVTRIFRDNKKQEFATGPTVIARVLNRWEQSKRYSTRQGKPRALTYKGEPNDFRDLVYEVDSSIGPGTVLFEMERQGLIRKKNEVIELLRRTSLYGRDPEKGFALLGRDMEDLMSSVSENIEHGAKSTHNLHIHTEYNNIFVKDLPRVRKWLLAEGARFHRKARDFLSELDRDLNPGKSGEAGARVVLTAFSLIQGKKE